MKVKALFVCSKNKLRSPTAEQIFADTPGLEVDSGGLSPDAEVPVGQEQVSWADVIFVMERGHKSKLSQRFQEHLNGKRVICLNIPDNYEFMDPNLVRLLKTVVPKYLPEVFGSSVASS